MQAENIEIVNFISIDSNGNTISGSIGCSKGLAEEILSKTYVKFKLVNLDELDLDYLAAYDISKKSIKLNLDKAKEIKKEELRRLRVDLLKALDIQFMLALEAGDRDQENKIIEEKKKLRDITKSVDSATTLDQIKAIGI